MATFHFELVSPQNTAFSGEVDQVDVPGTEGDFGVLAGHAPLIALIRPGVMKVTVAGETTEIVVLGGFAEVGPDGLTVLADVATSVEDLDRASLQQQIGQMEQVIKEMSQGGQRSDRWSRSSRKCPRARASTGRSLGSTISSRWISTCKAPRCIDRTIRNRTEMRRLGTMHFDNQNKVLAASFRAAVSMHVLPVFDQCEARSAI